MAQKQNPETMAPFRPLLAQKSPDPEFRFFTSRRLIAWLVVLLALIGPFLAIITVITVRHATQSGGNSDAVRAIFLADSIFIFTLICLIIWRIGSLLVARRRGSAGSQLHLRLAGLFCLIAGAPAILLAVFSTITINFGLENWFSREVGAVVRDARTTAESYFSEHFNRVGGDVLKMARDIDQNTKNIPINTAKFSQFVSFQSFVRELSSVYIIDGKGVIIHRSGFDRNSKYVLPLTADLSRAILGDVIVIPDIPHNAMRGLARLSAHENTLLYITRPVDGDVLATLERTRKTVAVYEKLELERDSILADFAALYVGFAVLVFLGAMLLGLWFADRLARPIGNLAGAANAVGAGDLTVRVMENNGTDEISLLSRIFNRMTEQVQQQHDALVLANIDAERRRLFSEAVLNGVSAGVLGLDANGQIELANPPAVSLLGIKAENLVGRLITEAVPIFSELYEQCVNNTAQSHEAQIRIRMFGEDREFFARISSGKIAEDIEGYVLTFDDLTELSAAQRMAAWGDVARRIAHEIKNPLTPIQLSAERLKAKFGPRLGEDQAVFENYANVIVRQAGDIKRMVDEFSSFSRMPEPNLIAQNIIEPMRDAVLLHTEGHKDVLINFMPSSDDIIVLCDRALLNQAFTNLIKNAIDAFASIKAPEADFQPVIEVMIEHRKSIGEINNSQKRDIIITITDNGPGFPDVPRRRLLEPYVTTRERGTGLGLSIVNRIIQQHNGELLLEHRDDGQSGAKIVIQLPSAHNIMPLLPPKTAQLKGLS